MAETLGEKVQRSFKEWDASTLEAEVARANKLYWTGKPTGLSDALFDSLVSRLETLNPDSSALVRIGFGVSLKAKRIAHASPMLSLQKVHDVKGVHAWISSTQGCVIYVSPKVDGIACTLSYGRDGKIRYAATRGNGRVGEVITDVVVKCGAVPDQIPEGPLEIRGELYISKSYFSSLTGFSCARNVVAGYVKQNKPDEAFPLQFFPYDVVGACTTMQSKIDLFRSLDLDYVSYEIKRTADLARFSAQIEDDRVKWDFDADGVVFRVGTNLEFDRLGATAHHPRGAIALKFSDELAETVVDRVDWDVSRTGAITPVAMFAPVYLAGAEISCATLHHLGRYRSLGVRPGSRIAVVRRGGVIPHVHAMVDAGPARTQPGPPTCCPSCEGPVITEDGVTRGAASLRCAKPLECSGSSIARVIHFASTVGIKGLGPSMMQSLFDRGIVTGPSGLMDLLYNAGGAPQGKNLNNLIAEIESHREIPFDVFLASLGLEHLGPTTARAIASKWDYADLFDLTYEDLITVQGIGENAAASITSQVAAYGTEIINLGDLMDVQSIKGEKGKKVKSGPLSGASILFTGALQMSRSLASQRAIERGAVIASGVTRTLDFLITSDPSVTSAKLEKARALMHKGYAIQILSEHEFQEMLR